MWDKYFFFLENSNLLEFFLSFFLKLRYLAQKKKKTKKTNKQEGSSNWVGFNFNDAILPVIQKKRVGSVK